MTTDHDTTDQDVVDRLSDLLARSARAVHVHPDIDAVINRSSIVALDRGSGTDAGRRQRRAVTVIGIAAALLIVVGIAVVIRSTSEPGQTVASGGSTSSTTEPPAPGPGELGFPILDHPPAGVDVEPIASYTTVDADRATGVHALIGRTSGTSVRDAILVEAYPATPAVFLGDFMKDVVVAGRPAVILDPGPESPTEPSTEVVFPGAPTLRLLGQDPIAFVEANPDAIRASSQAEAPGVALDITSLPAGLTVMRQPEPRSTLMSQPSVFAISDQSAGNSGFVIVTTSDDDPLMLVAGRGGADAVDVGGRPGWTATLPGSTLLAWTAADGTTVLLETGLDPEAAVAYAVDEVRLVDEAEWQTHYRIDQGEHTASPTSATTTIPAPPGD